jgi:hypothetical protein
VLHRVGDGHAWYLSNAGSDLNDGRSPSHAWKTITRLNASSFRPGDTILFQGGQQFTGTWEFRSGSGAEAGHPIVIGTFGKGRATIDGGEGDGIYIRNVSGLEIRDLICKGSGILTNHGSGLDFFSDDTLHALTGFSVIDCEASGFRNYGFIFWSASGSTVKGFQKVRLINCKAHGNGEAGIASFAGYQGRFVHRDFYLSGCKAYDNPGILGQTNGHSGNGIVMGSVEGLLIRHCEAFGNGRDNSCNAGGPVGIWVWLCHRAIIEHCVSHDNHTGSLKDGGGFDIDGGSSDCVIQYNYSYHNDGAGYLLAEYGAGLPFRENLIRFNISLEDGRKNGYGAITVWGAGSSFQVTGSGICHNLVMVANNDRSRDPSSAVRLMGDHFSKVICSQNMFLTGGAAILIHQDSALDPDRIHFICNGYYSNGDSASIRQDTGSFLIGRQPPEFAEGFERTDPGIRWPQDHFRNFPWQGLIASLHHPFHRLACTSVTGDIITRVPRAAIDFYGHRISAGDHFTGITIR